MQYCIVVLLTMMLVYFVPALACYPKLITRPRWFYGIPLVSGVLVYLLVSISSLFGFFSSSFVALLSLSFFIMALVRVLRLPVSAYRWSRHDVIALGLLVLVVLPYAAKLGLWGFDRDDEIYSWNFWALQTVLGEGIDFSHTAAAYPQLLPKLIAYCYQLWGNTDWQLPIKASLILFTLSLLGQLYCIIAKDAHNRLLFTIVIFYLLVIAGLERYFKDAYADPLMSAYVVSSIAMALYAIKEQSKEHYILAAVLAVGGFLSKQPGLIWACIGLPLVWLSLQGKLRLTWWLCGGVWLCAVLWFATEGSTFHHNTGAIGLSMQNRGALAQLAYGVERYFLHEPTLSLLFALGAYCAIRHQLLRWVFVGFFIPAMLLWLMFAAYQLRTGQHLLSVSALFILFYLRDFGWRNVWVSNLSNKINRPVVLSCFVGFCLAFTGLIVAKSTVFEKPGVDPFNGPKHSIYRHFGADSELVYRQLYVPGDQKLWVPTRYLYGLFYRHAEFITADYSEGMSRDILLGQLLDKRPDYIFTASRHLVDGPANNHVEQLIHQCPQAFKQLNTAPNQHCFVAYQFRVDELQKDHCMQAS